MFRYEDDRESSQEEHYGRSPRYGRPPYSGGYRSGTSSTGSTSYRAPNVSSGSRSPRGSRPPQPKKNPLIGTRVRHAKYGLGTIIEVDGEGEDRRLTVSFQDFGPKKLVERYAN